MKDFPLKQVAWNLFLISAGSILYAITVNGILVPKGFLSGGIIGVAILIHQIFPTLDVGWMYLLLNIPVYMFAWLYVGRRFFIYSLVGLLVFSGATLLIQVTISIQDKILAAMLAGILAGAGGGLILRSLGSAGGLDILSILILKRFSVRLGSSVLAFNSILLLAAAYLFSLEAALYTLLFMYVNTKVLNLVVTGLSQRKSALIISSKWKDISNGIISEIKRGVTVIHGEGGYSGHEENILYTVFTFRDLSRLKAVIKNNDPNAFVVINDTLEVIGHSIGNQPHW